MEGEPKELVELVFSKEPALPNTIQLVSENDENDSNYVFQLLANILFEALEYFTGDLSKISLDNFNIEYIKALDPWFQSMGFTIVTKEYNKSDEEYKQYYCRAIIKTSDYETFFIMKNIRNNFHFLLNGNYMEENKHKDLADLMLVFYGHNDKVFSINFVKFYN